jgi:transcriptional regulator with XRE-family HTH domain
MNFDEAKNKVARARLERENCQMAKAWRPAIKAVMKRRNLSAPTLGEKAGLCKTTVQHLLNEAQTITVECLRRIANATETPLSYFVTGHAVEVVDLTSVDRSTIKDIRILPLHLSDEEPGTDNGHGIVALAAADFGPVVHALVQPDNSMAGTDTDPAPPAADLVLAGDTVVYERGRSTNPGDLVVVDVSSGRGKLAVRRLEFGDDGDYYANALSQGFDDLKIDLGMILGKVTYLQRFRRKSAVPSGSRYNRA